tara:strand:+ start:641 stop:871 length:231 start_codon:yes stop_codon:yes gene_type:complete
VNTKEFADRAANALPAIAAFLVLTGFDLESIWGEVFYSLMYWSTLAISAGITCYAVIGLFDKPPSAEIVKLRHDRD